jgi:proteic killer suppression protein
MIRSFRSRALREFAETGQPRRLSIQNIDRLRLVLFALNAAASPKDMDQPGFRFHALKGDRRGTFSVTVTGNYRVTFRWQGEDAVDVDLEDYH